MNSMAIRKILRVLNPTLNYQLKDIFSLPVSSSLYKGNEKIVESIADKLLTETMIDWNSRETSWGFKQNELVRIKNEQPVSVGLEETYDLYRQYWTNKFYQLHEYEEELNQEFIKIYSLENELNPDVPLEEITILQDELDSKKLKKADDKWNNNGRNRRPALPFKDKEVFAQFVS